MWFDSRLNRPFERDPRLVVAWFILSPLAGLVAGAALLSAGSSLGYVCIGPAVVLVLQALVYVPRALRAARRR